MWPLDVDVDATGAREESFTGALAFGMSTSTADTRFGNSSCGLWEKGHGSRWHAPASGHRSDANRPWENIKVSGYKPAVRRVSLYLGAEHGGLARDRARPKVGQSSVRTLQTRPHTSTPPPSSRDGGEESDDWLLPLHRYSEYESLVAYRHC